MKIPSIEGAFLYHFGRKVTRGISGGVTGYFFGFCHGLHFMSRVKFGKNGTGDVTGYFDPKKCHGLLGAPGESFLEIVTGYYKNGTGKKNTANGTYR